MLRIQFTYSNFSILTLLDVTRWTVLLVEVEGLSPLHQK